MDNIYTIIHKGAVTAEPLLAWLACSSHWAQLTFFGVVRNHNDGKKNVTNIVFDVHEELALKVIKTIAKEAIIESGEESTRVYIAHAQGHVKLGELCIAIGVTSAHRKAAYVASRYIIEAVKTRVPVWKQEYYSNDTPNWLPGHALSA